MKHLIFLLILSLIIFNTNLFAAENSVLIQDTEEEDFKALKLKRPKEKFSLESENNLLEKDLGLQVIDMRLGIQLGDYHTSKDQSRMSLLYHVNADLKDLFESTSFEFIYAKKMQYAWWESSISLNNSTFNQVTENNEVALGVTTEDLLNAKSTTISVATGLSYRSTLIQDFLKTGDYFESMSALISYNIFKDSFVGDNFKGFGMKADLGVHKRLSANYHFGIRASYVLASVKRAQFDETENSSIRSLMLHWISIGADLSFYF